MEKHYEIIIKPSKDCNLSCSYCYALASIEKNKVMAPSTFKKIFVEAQKLIQNGATISFIWHGAEPLTAGIKIFEEIVKIQKAVLSEGRYLNGIQTNATLINDEWISFFKKYNFNLGISIDGPEKLHNYYRKNKNNNGSFQSIIKNIRILQNENIKFGAIAVISKKSSDNAENIYSFFKEEKINWKFNPLVSDDPTLSISPYDFGNFMIKLFDLWYFDKSLKNTIYTFEQIIENILNYKKSEPISCNHSSSCQNSFLSISTNGDVFPCNRFDHLESFKLGNIKTTNFKTLFKHKIKDKFNKRNNSNNLCSNCDFFNLCYSGCPYNAYVKYGTIKQRDIYCLSYKMIFKKIINIVYKELKQES